VLHLSSQKQLESLETFMAEDSAPDTSSSIDYSLGVRLDQSEAKGLQQHLGVLLERQSVGEIVENRELWNCLFGNAKLSLINQSRMRETDRSRRAEAAESRRLSAMVAD
jgi:hypothetical protein